LVRVSPKQPDPCHFSILVGYPCFSHEGGGHLPPETRSILVDFLQNLHPRKKQHSFETEQVANDCSFSSNSENEKSLGFDITGKGYFLKRTFKQ
jgi:hypothetical protein